MASSIPGKSQPLHNFDLPQLKWKKNSNSTSHHHRRHRSIQSPPFPTHLRESFSAPLRWGESSEPSLVCEPDLISELDSSLVKSEGPLIEYRRNHPTNSTNASSSDSARALEKAKQKLKGTTAARIEGNRSKILIKIPCSSIYSEQEIPKERPDIISEEVKLMNIKKDDDVTRKLRPRLPIGKKSESPLSNRSAFKGNSSGGAGGGGGAGGKKPKIKLSLPIPLAKVEIEEDIFALTGSKPSRKPLTRPKNIQKQLDFMFPGLKLVSLCADSYKVSENHSKG